MKRYRIVLILVNLILLLIYFNYSVVQKEDIRKDGKLLLLELAPVDPRSLMQGDYMDLRYRLAQDNPDLKTSKRGYCVLKADSNNIANAVRFQKSKTPLYDGEYLVSYTNETGWNLKIGAESFFFQEGEADKYDSARYGGIKIDEKGNSLLIGLYDEQRKMIR